MAVALDLNPVWVGPLTTVSLATAAFSPQAGSLLVIDSHIDLAQAAPLGFTPAITDSVGLTWTAIGTPQRGSGGGWVMSWWAYTATARTNMTVSVNWNGSAANKAIKVRTFTGTATTNAVIAKAQNSSTTNNLTVNVANTNDGCRIAGAALDWAARGLPTSTDSLLGYHLASAISGGSAHKATNTVGTGVSVPLNFDGGGTTATDWAYRIYEIVPAPAGGGTDLVPAAATQLQTADSPTLTQVHNLSPAAAVQAQTSDSPALSQVHNLTPSAAVQAQTADSPTLTQVHNLAVQDAAQVQVADSPTLSQTGGGPTLVVQDAVQLQTADAPTLTQVHVLAPSPAVQAQTSDTPTLTQAVALAVASAIQAQSADNVALTQVHSLAVGDASQAQTADSPTLAQVHFLLVDDATQAQVAGTVTVIPVTDVHLIAIMAFDGPATSDLAGDGPVTASLPRI